MAVRMPSERTGEDGQGFFSLEEQALMEAADHVENEPEPDLALLGIRVREMARLVAEGYERERLLRRAVALGDTRTVLDQHGDALLQAMKQLTDLLASSAEREVILRQMQGQGSGPPAD